MSNVKVTPRLTQTWVNKENHVEIELTSWYGNTWSWDSVDRSHSGTVYDDLIHERFTFKPANDLEFCAVNCDKWEVGYFNVSKSNNSVVFHALGNNDDDKYNYKQYRDMSIHLGLDTFEAVNNPDIAAEDGVSVDYNNRLNAIGWLKKNATAGGWGVSELPECFDGKWYWEENQFGKMILKHKKAIGICATQVFGYGESETVGETVKPVYTKAMCDAGESAPIGSTCVLTNESGYNIDYGHELVNREVTVLSDPLPVSGSVSVQAIEYDGLCYCFRSSMLKPVKADEEKLIDEVKACTGLRARDGLNEVVNNLMKQFNITRKS